MITDSLANEALEHLKHWVRDSNACLLGKKGPPGVKAGLAASSLQLAQEHARAIQVLLESKCPASAAALLRPQIDAMLRGVWIWQCASEEWCANYAETGDYRKAFNKKRLLSEIGATKVYRSGFLETMCGLMETRLHDYTHGGHRQMKSRLGQGGLVGTPRNNHAQFHWAVLARNVDFFAKLETARLLNIEGLEKDLWMLAAPFIVFDQIHRAKPPIAT